MRNNNNCNNNSNSNSNSNSNGNNNNDSDSDSDSDNNKAFIGLISQHFLILCFCSLANNFLEDVYLS